MALGRLLCLLLPGCFICQKRTGSKTYIYTHILRIPSDTASSHLHGVWKASLVHGGARGMASLSSDFAFLAHCLSPEIRFLHSNTIHKLGYKNSRRKISSIQSCNFSRGFIDGSTALLEHMVQRHNVKGKRFIRFQGKPVHRRHNVQLLFGGKKASLFIIKMQGNIFFQGISQD